MVNKCQIFHSFLSLNVYNVLSKFRCLAFKMDLMNDTPKNYQRHPLITIRGVKINYTKIERGLGNITLLKGTRITQFTPIFPTEVL